MNGAVWVLGNGITWRIRIRDIGYLLFVLVFYISGCTKLCVNYHFNVMS